MSEELNTSLWGMLTPELAPDPEVTQRVLRQAVAEYLHRRVPDWADGSNLAVLVHEYCVRRYEQPWHHEARVLANVKAAAAWMRAL